MPYAIKLTVNGNRVYVGNSGVPARYTSKKEAQAAIEKYFKRKRSRDGKPARALVVKYPPVKSMTMR